MSIDAQAIAKSQQLVVDVFKGFREELMASFGQSEFSLKADASQVTELDVIIEQTLKNKLTESFPQFGYQGEETGKSGNESQFWLVDPIDGTSSYIRGLPLCTNMAALIDDGQVVAAVIYDFVGDVLYTAVKGEGAFANGQQIKVCSTREKNNLFVYSLSGYRFEELRAILAMTGMKSFYPVGAAGHAYTLLARGKIDGVVVLNSRTGVHDNAPGLLLVAEAGGEVLPFDGRNDIYTQEFIIGSQEVVRLAESCSENLQGLVGR